MPPNYIISDHTPAVYARELPKLNDNEIYIIYVRSPLDGRKCDVRCCDVMWCELHAAEDRSRSQL